MHPKLIFHLQLTPYFDFVQNMDGKWHIIDTWKTNQFGRSKSQLGSFYPRCFVIVEEETVEYKRYTMPIRCNKPIESKTRIISLGIPSLWLNCHFSPFNFNLINLSLAVQVNYQCYYSIHMASKWITKMTTWLSHAFS